MKFGTFQQLPFDNNERLLKGIDKTPHVCDFKNVPRESDEELGFAPIWAFPMDSVESSFAHALLTEPNFADTFYIIETDDFTRINKIKHYQTILNGEYSLSNCIDNSVDNDHSEFCLKPDCLENGKILFAGSCTAAFALKSEDTVPFNLIFPLWKAISQEYQNDILYDIKLVEGMIPKLGANYKVLSAEMPKRRIERTTFYREVLLNYIVALLPMISHATVDSSNENGLLLDSFYFFSAIFSLAHITAISNNFARWAAQDCDIETYDILFQRAKKMVITDRTVLSYLSEENIPGRNELCPCGSGKKWKKCHGRYMDC